VGKITPFSPPAPPGVTPRASASAAQCGPCLPAWSCSSASGRCRMRAVDAWRPPGGHRTAAGACGHTGGGCRGVTAAERSAESSERLEQTL
jgi:hypothetical protein